MRILTTTLLVTGMALAGPTRAAVHPTTVHVDESAADAPLRVAKRKRKGRKPAKVEPVRIRSGDTAELSLEQKGRKTLQVYAVTPDAPLAMEVTGPGKLALVVYQLLPKSTKTRKQTFLISVDGKRATKVKVTNKPFRKGTLAGDVSTVSNGKKRLERLKGGTHTVQVTAPAGSAGAVVRIEMYVTGAKMAAPVVIEPQRSDLMAAALDALDDDEEPPPPPPEPPPSPVEPVEVAAAPIAPTEPVEPVADPTAALAARLSAGEIRDGLVGDYQPATVVDEDSGERTTFQRIASEESFSFMVQGPGEVTVRLHRLVAGITAAASEYKIVILENDVLLQQLSGATEVLTRRKLEPSLTAMAPPALSDAKEYRLKVGPKQSRFAFQIAQAPEGMVIRYRFAAEEASLASMALDFDDEDDDEDGIGFSMGTAALPTVVMEVDVTEKTIVVEQSKGFLGLGVYAGTMVPVAGGGMGVVGTFEISAALPWLDRAFVVAVDGTFITHDMTASIGDPAGAAINARSTVYAVPVIGKVIGRLRLAEIFALYGHGGFGVSYVRAERRALGSKTATANWLWTLRGGAGVELELGPGAMIVDAAFLFAPTADFGTSLEGYTPTGPVFTAGYRMGL
ncbi:MAG: hypothetical protein JRI68_34350 [Deltaproteobacteria bacterium]|nr:hypothetical protein [Deltaproteobacteria bacterium]